MPRILKAIFRSDRSEAHETLAETCLCLSQVRSVNLSTQFVRVAASNDQNLTRKSAPEKGQITSWIAGQEFVHRGGISPLLNRRTIWQGCCYPVRRPSSILKVGSLSSFRKNPPARML